MGTKVKPILKGYHAVTLYLSVKGAAEAIEFYKKAFGAKAGSGSGFDFDI